MRIGELAARTGVSVRSLRYYEEQHLLPAVRSSGGHRHYPEPAVHRVALIQHLFSAGLSSRTIGELMVHIDAGVSTPEARSRLIAERDRIERQMTELAEARDRLNEVIEVSYDPDAGCSFRPGPA
ncbi:MerR family transcriptional regulator [Actinoplanes sp. NBRC 14428]|uniref:DNA-binding transcriptional MerR regulator n=1 Tax=Pseudosporangium ferrugineum TaxID=439699 RepID=A0A2T0RQM9_9ACTN|nr:MerR family transcriptional regulator [Pseudosporangium ferrugineum]PRY23410.1 DNA-binding transcriptional MerR regulator [Pseudosporangium ferrugineum]BCJ55413.1 MerR family transcriptional regulator [Actinoplanes sp. NBRC 14428]